MLLKGKPIVDEIKAKVNEIVSKSNKTFTIAVIAPTDDKASIAYVKTRENLCAKLNINMKAYIFNKPSQEELINLIKQLNEDDSIHGIMVDRPLPNGIDENKVFNTIKPSKDIDGCNSENAKLLQQGQDCLVPSTAEAVKIMLDYYKIDANNKKVTIVNNSISVGRPLAQLLKNNNANVTVCDKDTKDIKAKCMDADIVIVAIGHANYFDESYFNKDATVIDVGINVDEQGNVCGDVKSSTQDHVKNISPVPGGVGPLTNVVLLTNMLKGQGLW